jgi:hypothetical protein
LGLRSLHSASRAPPVGRNLEERRNWRVTSHRSGAMRILGYLPDNLRRARKREAVRATRRGSSERPRCAFGSPRSRSLPLRSQGRRAWRAAPGQASRPRRSVRNRARAPGAVRSGAQADRHRRGRPARPRRAAHESPRRRLVPPPLDAGRYWLQARADNAPSPRTHARCPMANGPPSPWSQAGSRHRAR